MDDCGSNPYERIFITLLITAIGPGPSPLKFRKLLSGNKTEIFVGPKMPLGFFLWFEKKPPEEVK